MKKPLIYLLLIVLAGVAGYVLLGDIFLGNPQKSAKNPYAYDLGDIYKIDPSLIKYKGDQTNRADTSPAKSGALSCRTFGNSL
ncbi:MAG: hypothetical protein U5K79_01110 [Cyclobacteriaceae bacterium]|nr:hypothetical protein [Cyclobacteriaceae bacterium]